MVSPSERSAGTSIAGKAGGGGTEGGGAEKSKGDLSRRIGYSLRDVRGLEQQEGTVEGGAEAEGAVERSKLELRGMDGEGRRGGGGGGKTSEVNAETD